METETLGQTLIPVVNKLQDLFSQVDFTPSHGSTTSSKANSGAAVPLDLPQVAVVGSQSSGKSSVLEALVGRDFLPRGPNIVTRRPLVLQLVKTTAVPQPGQYTEWGEFLHAPGKRFFDFDRIRHEIVTETDRLLGPNKGISDQPIRLRIHSPHVVTMTVVDLPGLARVPVGDQPPDIEARLRRLILDYISSPSCIILAVTAANQDLASSDALALARKADPEGTRTIGVLTKLDIMDRGTDAVAALRNEVVPLRLGYVGVVLRSQEDVAARKTMVETRDTERAFFASRPEYSSLAGACGVTTLARALNGLLVEAIREALPGLRSRVEEALSQRRRELRVYGDAPPGSTGAARGALLLSILDGYSARFTDALDGHSEHLPLTELAGGARIRHVFQEIFTAGLDALDPTAELTDDDVRTAIKNSGGIKGSLLIPEKPFELLVRRAIDRLLSPSLHCKELVHSELLLIAAQCIPTEAARFPVLQTVLSEAVEEFINSGAAPAERMIRDLVSCELAYINTSHPQFIGGNRAIAQVLERRGVAGAGSDGGNEDTLAAHRPRSGGATHQPRAHPVAGAVASSASPNGLAAAAKLHVAEPELFRPEDLLESNHHHRHHHHHGNSAAAAEVVPRGWLSQWFPRSGAGGGQHTNSADPSSPSESSLQRPPPTLRVPHNITDQEAVQVEVTRVLVDSYFDIVRKNLQDAVPKALMHFVVNSVRRGLQQHLIRTLYREDLLEDLMSEREDVAARRARCQDAVRALRAALKTLEALPGELTGRVINTSASLRQSGAWSFKKIAQEVERAERRDRGEAVDDRRPRSRNASPLKNGLREQQRERSHVVTGVGAAGGGESAVTPGQRAQKAALAAVSFLGGGRPAAV